MGKCAGLTVAGLSLFLALVWTIMISLPTGWHTKSTLIWNFDVGLYYVKVEPAMLGSVAHMGAKVGDLAVSSARGKKTTVLNDGLGHLTTGEEKLQFYRDMFCNLAIMPLMNSNCAPWEHLLIGSWIMLITTIMTIILLVTGAGFMWYYAQHNARRQTRLIGMGLLAGAAFFNLFGLGGYTALTFQFGAWLSDLMLSSARCTFSFVFIMAFMLHLFTWAPLLIAWTCAANPEEEDIAEEMAWERKKILYGCDDEFDDQECHYDANGNPIQAQVDEYGNPVTSSTDLQVQQYDSYGNPVHGSCHASAYPETEAHQAGPSYPHMDPYHTDQYPAQGSYHSDHPAQGSYHSDPASNHGAYGQDTYAQLDSYAQGQSGSYTSGQEQYHHQSATHH